MKYFWTNTIWYVLLGIITLLQFVFVMTKAKSRSLALALYITFLGLTLNYETTILIFLKAYTYYPMILHNPPIPFDDVLAGNLFSQFSISTTALMVTFLDLNYYWFIIFAVIYGVIEEFFLAIGIYTHNWYQTWMTVVSIPLLFVIANKMYDKYNRGIKPIYYYGYIFLGLFTLNIITLTWGLMLLRLQDFSRTVLPDPIMSRHLLAMVHFFMLSIPLMFIHFSKPKWYWTVLITLALYVLYFLGYKYNLILIKDGWFLVVSTLSIVWMYISIFIHDKLYDRE